MSDMAVRALMQSILGGSTAQEDQALVNEVARRFILSGFTVSNTGVISFSIPVFDVSILQGTANRLAAFDGSGLGTSILLTNAYVDGAAAIARSKLDFGSGLVNADIAAAAAIAYSKLNLTGQLLNADVNAAAAIAWTKISKAGSSLADLATRSAGDLSSGTLPQARLGAAQDIGLCQGRLTLTSATPVTISDVTAAGTVYFTPYKGNRLALYDGASAWNLYAFTELSIAVPAVANQMYDVFVYDNAGTPTLELTAWTNDTTRATAITTQDGIRVKTGATTRRYLGSFRTLSASQTEDSFSKRLVWNQYNQVERAMRVNEPANSYTYATAGFQQANANANNQIAFVVGIAEQVVEANVLSTWGHSTLNGYAAVGIGEDSTTVPSVSTGQNATTQSYSNAGAWQISQAQLRKYPAVGYHFWAWLEYASGATVTFYGDNGGVSFGPQSGISGTIWG